MIIPILVALVGFLGLMVHEQNKQHKKQQINQVVEDATLSLREMNESQEVMYIRKMNADRHL